MKLMRIKRRALIGLAWTCLLFGGGAMGVVLKPLSLNEMLERATNVTISEVSEMKSFWQEGRILTWVTVETTTTFKGSTGTLRIGTRWHGWKFDSAYPWWSSIRDWRSKSSFLGTDEYAGWI